MTHIDDSGMTVDLRPSPRKRWLGVLRSILIYSVLFFGIGWWQTRTMLESGPGSLAPPLQLRSLSGSIVALDKPLASSIMLYFFAPWCAVCGANVGSVNDVYTRSQEAKDFEVYAVAVDFESTEQISRYARDHEMKMPILLAREETSRNFKIGALPSYYFINRQGEIKAKASGYTTYLGLLFRTIWTNTF
jgi:peroxiredoxin